MNIFISILFLISLTLAEPPVGDGYPEARSAHDHHNDDHTEQHDQDASGHQRSLSEEYGPPGYASRNAVSDELFGARNAPITGRQSQKYSPPTARVSFNQRFSSAATRTSTRSHQTPARSFSQGSAIPNTRGAISQKYGPPAARSLSQEYGTPASMSARTVSTEYGVPNARATPSEEYGAPVIAARNNQNLHLSSASSSLPSNFRNAKPATSSQDYSAPATRSQFQTGSFSYGSSAHAARSNELSQGYDASEAFVKSDSGSQSPSQSYGAPKSALSSTYDAPASRSLSTSYGAPAARSFDSYSQDHDSISQTYSAPNGRDVSETYGAPNARGQSEKYNAPSSRTNQKAGASVTAHAPANSRSSPSSTYLPAARDSMPSQQYGVPEQDNKGYEDARARALEELLNQEPASYDFAYQIEDQESGTDFGHTESRQDNRAEGSYFVVLPDGTKQTVEYEADERGFKPRISVEPADLSSRSGGYDNNAAEISRSTGPY